MATTAKREEAKRRTEDLGECMKTRIISTGELLKCLHYYVRETY